MLLAVATLALLPACGGSRDPLSVANGGNTPGAGTGQPPFVRIVSPGPNSSCPEGATLSVHVVAEDPNTILASVQLFDGDRPVREKSEPPYLFSLGGLKPGSHVLTAVAIDIEGIRAESLPVSVFVTSRDHDDDDDDDRRRRRK